MLQDHPGFIDFIVWPRLRERLALTWRDHDTDNLIRSLVYGFKIRNICTESNQPLIRVKNNHNGFEVSGELTSALADISNFAMQANFLAQYPDLAPYVRLDLCAIFPTLAPSMALSAPSSHLMGPRSSLTGHRTLHWCSSQSLLPSSTQTQTPCLHFKDPNQKSNAQVQLEPARSGASTATSNAPEPMRDEDHPVPQIPLNDLFGCPPSADRLDPSLLQVDDALRHTAQVSQFSSENSALWDTSWSLPNQGHVREWDIMGWGHVSHSHNHNPCHCNYSGVL
ncbi:hypothetical protein BJY00DRAFT_287176 [Aspergillus carlsbadensis]|nr:hypothetical protein BJY00DRAFT_287176 [Aspergillus carlsbadensis]